MVLKNWIEYAKWFPQIFNYWFCVYEIKQEDENDANDVDTERKKEPDIARPLGRETSNQHIQRSFSLRQTPDLINFFLWICFLPSICLYVLSLTPACILSPISFRSFFSYQLDDSVRHYIGLFFSFYLFDTFEHRKI